MNMKVNRKDNSLGVLCQRFLKYSNDLSENKDTVIYLKTMINLLNMKRRRIYDIVNVLESVEMLSKYHSNQYIWHGFVNLTLTLSKLKTLAIKSNFLGYTKLLMFSQLDNCEQHDLKFNKKRKLDASNKVVQQKTSREEKSLGIMAQKFLMLFLTAEDGLVSINFAARVLLGDSKNDITELGRFKTKIRRLYDIANVLSSIGLIEKYLSNDSSISKPAYRYIGPEVNVMRDAECVYDFMNAGNPLSNSKHSLFDHFKRNLDLECGIPKFDINTGILTSRENEAEPSTNKKFKLASFDKTNEFNTNRNYMNLLNSQQNNFQLQSTVNYQMNNAYDQMNTQNYTDVSLYSNQMNSFNFDTFQTINSCISYPIANTSDITSYSSTSYNQFFTPIQNNWNNETYIFDNFTLLTEPQFSY